MTERGAVRALAMLRSGLEAPADQPDAGRAVGSRRRGGPRILGTVTSNRDRRAIATMYRLPDRTQLAVGMVTAPHQARSLLLMGRHACASGSLLISDAACGALITQQYSAPGLTDVRAVEMLAMWVEEFEPLPPVSGLRRRHIGRLLMSSTHELRLAAIRLLDHVDDAED